MMPEMDGFQFLEEKRRHDAWRLIPVVVVTAMELTPAERRRLSDGVKTILRKTRYTPEELCYKLRELIVTPT